VFLFLVGVSIWMLADGRRLGRYLLPWVSSDSVRLWLVRLTAILCLDFFGSDAFESRFLGSSDASNRLWLCKPSKI
jgi:hypothetical protein